MYNSFYDKYFCNKKTAFTLAEVLITLSVLGIVAAIIIPNIGHYKKTMTETRLKQAYSILENTLEMAKVEHGSIQQMFDNSYRAGSGTQMNKFFVENYFLPYLTTKKSCSGNCGIFSFNSPGYNNGTYMDKNAVLSLSGKRNNTGMYTPSDWYNTQLNNGMSIGILVDYWGKRRIIFIVDINGTKVPNRVGYDIFYFSVFRNYSLSDNNKSDRVYAGTPSLEKDENDQTCSGEGTGCAAPIKRNGWKIPDDYPVKF